MKKSPSSNTFDRLTSLDLQVVAIDCQLRPNCIWVGLLCLAGHYRHKIDQSTTVDLIDRDQNLIATVKLDPTFQGEKNGYIPNITLGFRL